METEGNKRKIKEKQKENNGGEQKRTKVSKMIWRQSISTQEENKKNERRISTQEYIDSAPSFDLKISQYFRDDL